MSVSVMIDGLDNLAGLKLVIRYDDAVLTYAGGEKSPACTGFMHIVDSQLMSADLKKLNHDTQPFRIAISPAAAPGGGLSKVR